MDNDEYYQVDRPSSSVPSFSDVRVAFYAGHLRLNLASWANRMLKVLNQRRILIKRYRWGFQSLIVGVDVVSNLTFN